MLKTSHRGFQSQSRRRDGAISLMECDSVHNSVVGRKTWLELRLATDEIGPPGCQPLPVGAAAVLVRLTGPGPPGNGQPELKVTASPRGEVSEMTVMVGAPQFDEAGVTVPRLPLVGGLVPCTRSVVVGLPTTVTVAVVLSSGVGVATGAAEPARSKGVECVDHESRASLKFDDGR